MGTFVVVIHVLVCVVLIVSVLLQSGKGGGLSSAFGGGGGAAGGMSSQMFGGRGAASFLSKVTAIVAVLYMVLVIGLNLMQSEVQGPRSIIQEEALKNQQASPAQGLPTVPAEGQPAAAEPTTPEMPAAPDDGDAGTTQPQ